MRIYARNCIVKEINNNEAEDFLNKYHYQGFIPAKVTFGLFYDNELVQLESFGKPRYNKKYSWELLRLCTKDDYIVCGGASKLLKAFTEEYDGSIISYCNRDRFSGNVYTALGFKSKGITKGYHYEKDGKTYHRSMFTKHNCLKMWPNKYNESFTERDIMKAEGFIRVDDKIGQETFTFNENIKFYIYEIICNGYHYIGQHSYGSNGIDDCYYGSGTIINRLEKKYPFSKTILFKDIGSQDLADKYEKCMIRISKALYGELNCNIKEGGRGYVRTNRNSTQGRKGTPHTDEFKQRLSERMKGHTLSNEAKERISKANSHPLSEAHKEHISAGIKSSDKFTLAMKDPTRCSKISTSLKGHGNNHNNIKEQLRNEGYLLVEDILERDNISLSQFKRRKKKGLYIKKGQRGSISYY